MVAVQDVELLEAFEGIDELCGSLPAESKAASSDARQKSDRLFSAFVVSKTVTARYLDVTGETMNAWLELGILRPARAERSPKVFIDLRSLLRAHREVVQIRALGQRSRFRQRLAAVMDAQGFDGRPEIATAIRRGMEAIEAGDRGVTLPESWYDADGE